MSEPSCEEVQCSVAAVRDGERPGLEVALVDGHLAWCEACRLALEGDAAVRAALKGRVRAAPVPAPTWPAVASAIVRRPGRWVAMAAAAVVVLGQAVVLGPGVGLGWPARAAPLVAASLLFAALRTNPFRLDTHLT